MRDALGAETEWCWINITGLHLKARPVDRASIKARRSSSFQAATPQAKILQRLTEQRRRSARPTGLQDIVAPRNG